MFEGLKRKKQVGRWEFNPLKSSKTTRTTTKHNTAKTTKRLLRTSARATWSFRAACRSSSSSTLFDSATVRGRKSGRWSLRGSFLSFATLGCGESGGFGVRLFRCGRGSLGVGFRFRLRLVRRHIFRARRYLSAHNTQFTCCVSTLTECLSQRKQTKLDDVFSCMCQTAAARIGMGDAIT